MAYLCLSFVGCASHKPKEKIIVPQPYPDWIVQIQVGSSGLGTGFLLESSNNFIYLVTAKHVLFNPTNGALNATNAICRAFRTDVPADERLTQWTLNLQALLERNQIKSPPNRDIVAVQLCIKIGNTEKVDIVSYSGFITFDSTNSYLITAKPSQCSRMKDVPIGAETLSVGFSSSGTALHPPEAPDSVDAWTPLLRKGLVAGKYEKRGTLVLDSRVYPGDSGGPVMMKKYLSDTKYIFPLIGVQTQVVPGKDKWAKELSNSGYSVIEPLDSILDMIN